LFRADYRGGVALLNRMLDHAARCRVRILSSLRDGAPPEEDLSGMKSVLSVAGEPREYVGDGHVWLWYRGTGVGPYPCMSALQALGGYYVGHTLKNASNVYGTFGLVIGLLSWIYLSAHITLLAAEGNVVATRRLWPRSFSLMIEQPATEADKRALTQRGRVEERRRDETVSVDFPASDETETSATGGGSEDTEQRPSV
jgi:Virulence factor BrkB